MSSFWEKSWQINKSSSLVSDRTSLTKLIKSVKYFVRTVSRMKVRTRDAATLAHLFFHLHFYFVRRSGEWIHDGDL